MSSDSQRRAAKRYAQKMIAYGKCRACGKPRAETSVVYCEVHLLQARLRSRAWQRKKHGYVPQTEGGIGRPCTGRS